MFELINPLRYVAIALAWTMSCSLMAFSQDRVPDLVVPKVSEGQPAAGKRVRQQLDRYLNSDIHHLVYLPRDWKPGKRFPVVVEYAGNKWRSSKGTVEGSSLGFGVTGGQGAIWLCLPFVESKKKVNATQWWGDVDATVKYCQLAVAEVCRRYGGDPKRVFLAGFSRGAIACNYIGLHDDKIASLWCGFICHSHYDGVRDWSYANSDKRSAAIRLKRLASRPQWISQENSIAAIQAYLKSAYPDGNFTLVPIKGFGHTDKWVLYDVPERKRLREWFAKVSQSK